MFFALSMGLGLPYLFLGIFSGKISALPRAGQWMMGIRHLFGVILLIMAVYFLAPLFPERLKDLALAGALVAGGAGLIIFDWSGRDSRFFHVIKSSAAVAMVVVGMWMYKPAPDNGVTLPWQTYSDTALSDAEAGHRPVIIDFFADWCIPCKELDAVTFKDPRVTDFRNDFVFLKADLSREGTEAVARLRNRFGILGVPTIVFIGAEGKEWEDLRLTGFEEPALFADRMKKALEPKKPAASEKETQ
jgi:thiol:disulfide interchange protein DsbD